MAHIVVLDPNRERQRFYTEALAGHVVSFVDRPVEAVYLARAFPQDLILTDWFEADGPRVLEELERLRDFVPPPVIFVTDVRSEELTEQATVRAISKGATWLIPLPMSREAFRKEVESAMAEFHAPVDVLEMEITGMTPPETANEFLVLLKGIRDVQLMIDQTVGWAYLERLVHQIVHDEGTDEAQHCCAMLFECARSDMQTLYAAAWSSQYGGRARRPSEELLFRISHGMLFPNNINR